MTGGSNNEESTMGKLCVKGVKPLGDLKVEIIYSWVDTWVVQEDYFPLSGNG